MDNYEDINDNYEYESEGVTNVSEQYKDYIKNNIIKLYKKKIIAPLIYLICIILLSIVSPVYSIIFPADIESTTAIKPQYDNNRYISGKLSDLYFTGYTKEWLFGTEGYYYYTLLGNDTIIVLLTPDTCKYGEPVINSVNIKGKINKNNKTEKDLLNKLSSDLHWDEGGINDTISGYNINEPTINNAITMILIILSLASTLIALFFVLLYGLFILMPRLSTPIIRLKAYGDSDKLLDLAEQEIALVPQLATEDMYITQHFFIEISTYGIAIIPIDEIIWIYQHSTLHKFLWHHFKISYTLHIVGNKRLYIKCPKNEKSDVGGVIDYLAEANHNILVGFSEQNRIEVEKLQGQFMPFRNLMKYLSDRVKK